jgi:glutamate racemase
VSENRFGAKLKSRRSSDAIGVFDSGVGGLTVLRELYRQLPQESVIYFGDTARVPYGTRSRAQILQFVWEILTWMEQQQVKMVIMACNTSSALVLEEVRSEFKVPILGLILPGARAAVQRGRRIGVIATPATAASNAYKQAIAEIDSSAEVWQVGCPEFVPSLSKIAFRNLIPKRSPRTISHLDAAPDRHPDLWLHPLSLFGSCAAPDFAAHCPVNRSSGSRHRCGRPELDLLGLRSSRSPHPTRFCVSGAPASFVPVASQWLGFTPTVEQVCLTGVYQPTLETVD